MKKTKKVGKSKTRCLLLDEEGILMSKSEKTDKISGFLELTCTHMDLLSPAPEPKIVDANCDVLHGFRFIRNGKITEFFTKDLKLFQ